MHLKIFETTRSLKDWNHLKINSIKCLRIPIGRYPVSTKHPAICRERHNRASKTVLC